jgi:uncharacterized protein (TIGR03067 family)
MKAGLRAAFGVALTLVVLAPAAARADDLDTMQGKWQVIHAAVGAKVATASQMKSMSVTVEGNKFTLVTDKKEVVHFTPYSKRSPKEVEFKRGKGDAKLLWHGIYELEGKNQRLRLCWGPAGADRPKSFEAKRRDDHRLFILEKK